MTFYPGKAAFLKAVYSLNPYFAVDKLAAKVRSYNDRKYNKIFFVLWIMRGYIFVQFHIRPFEASFVLCLFLFFFFLRRKIIFCIADPKGIRARSVYVEFNNSFSSALISLYLFFLLLLLANGERLPEINTKDEDNP